MKKLFTLFAFLACFLGANAVLIEDYNYDFTQGKLTVGWKGECVLSENISVDGDGLHVTNTEVQPNWYEFQYQLISGTLLDVDQFYTIKLVMKVNQGSAKVRLRLGDWSGGISSEVDVNNTEYQEYEISGAATASSNFLLVQYGDYVGTVSFKSIVISHEGKQERPIEWIELIQNGNAETPWGDLANVKYNDTENNYKVSVWSKEKGVNLNEDGGSDPHPAEIVAEADGNHAFICRATLADTEGDAAAWDNQIWLESPRAWKADEQFKLHFRYKASQNVTTNTQYHLQNPSAYKHYQAIGDIAFTTEWQEFDQVITVPGEAAGSWSIAFNLNPNVKDPTDFYIDDLSWQEMKLDQGLFASATNTESGLVDYDFDSAVELTYDADEDAYFTTVGTKGKQDTWVNEVMISTVRGNDRAFKSNTLKAIAKNGEWVDFTEGSNAKIKLPAQGVYNIWVALEDKQLKVEQVEGEEIGEPIEINPNPTHVTIHGVERDWKPAKEDGTPADGEEGVGTGQPWDNQFCIMATRPLAAGESTVVSFKYKAAKAATSNTQCGGSSPGAYVHWNCLGDINFTTEEQQFEKVFTVPADADGMQSLTFNLAVMKEANDYEIWDIIWKTEDNTESLINMENGENLYVKTGAGTAPEPITDGIQEITVKPALSNAVYNIAGQRVANSFKGVAIKNGQKYIVK